MSFFIRPTDWGGSTEGDRRLAVSRGYYGVFHFFRDFLLAHGVNVGQGSACLANLYNGLNNCGRLPRPSPAASTTCGTQRESRLRHETSRRSTAGRAVHSNSAALIADFQAALSTIPAAVIAAGAKRYLQSIGRIPVNERSRRASRRFRRYRKAHDPDVEGVGRDRAVPQTE